MSHKQTNRMDWSTYLEIFFRPDGTWDEGAALIPSNELLGYFLSPRRGCEQEGGGFPRAEALGYFRPSLRDFAGLLFSPGHWIQTLEFFASHASEE